MKIQMLTFVMNQFFDHIACRTQPDSDTAIINQCDRLKSEEKKYNGYFMRFCSFPERDRQGPQ